MAAINNELHEKIQGYQLALALKTSTVEAERVRAQSFSEDVQDLTQRMTDTLKLLEEQDTVAQHMQQALNLANQQRIQVEMKTYKESKQDVSRVSRSSHCHACRLSIEN